MYRPTDTLYSQTGYDVVDGYFQSEVIVKKTVKMPPSTALGRISPEHKLYILIGDNQLQKAAGYYVTSCFRSAAKCCN